MQRQRKGGILEKEGLTTLTNYGHLPFEAESLMRIKDFWGTGS